MYIELLYLRYYLFAAVRVGNGIGLVYMYEIQSICGGHERVSRSIAVVDFFREILELADASVYATRREACDHNMQLFLFLFSSPGPKDHSELLPYQCVRRASSVNT